MLAQDLQSAFALYQQRRFAAAETACRALVTRHPDAADAWRLLGMVLSADGKQAEARSALRRSLALAPGHVEALNSLGIAAGRAGDSREAETAYRDALSARADYAPARRNLAGLLVSSGRAREALGVLDGVSGPDFDRLRGEAHARLNEPEAALVAFQRAAGQRPGDVRAFIGSAGALTELGRFEAALGVLDGVEGAEADIARAKAWLGAGQADNAIGILSAVLAAAPARADALFLMAQCLWMSGRGSEIRPWFEAARRSAPDRSDLLRLYARTLKQMDEADAALDVLKALPSPGPADHSERADVLIEAGRAGPALEAAQIAVESDPDDPAAQAAHARAALMNGQARTALEAAQRMRARYPHDQFWVAIEAEALRQTDPARWRQLYDPDRLARPFDLPTPDGFESLEAFNQALAVSLRRLHAFKVHPLDQSLRSGVQTGVDLRRVGDPVIDAFFRSAQSVVEDYVAAMPEDDAHPLFAYRSEASEIVSAWSVLLGPGGRHVSHVHPEGWISSAYYVETPGDLESSRDQEGWLVLGEPPFKVPGAEPTRLVPAKPGRLVLFPSFLWHGTRPIRSGERLSIAFDILPRARAAS